MVTVNLSSALSQWLPLWPIACRHRRVERTADQSDTLTLSVRTVALPLWPTFFVLLATFCQYDVRTIALPLWLTLFRAAGRFLPVR